MSLIKFNNPKNGHTLAPMFNDLFESFLSESPFSDRMIARVPAVNISENENAYSIELAAPGLNKENFKIQLDKNLLTISVEQKSESNQESKQYNKREFSYSSFVRSFALPESADDSNIDAEYTDGILKIAVQKKEEAKSIARQIEIR
ncbi:MAG: Hsp20/alpha crystallin family protein [Pedobacter sp.]|uniref:Hsp20/alpha crystallin family protein n=1 Tax=Pedobacter sp. TaxID=1411316 RepID=UPI0033947B3D